MEIEDLIDRYKTTKSSYRFIFVFFIALLPGIYTWIEEGDRIALELESISQQEKVERTKLERARRKVSQLPELLDKLNLIEDELQRAKSFLPDDLEIDRILSILGSLEVRYNVQILKMTLGKESSPKDGLDYQEVPIDLEIKGQFRQIMQFYDSLVHLTNLTHLRSIELKRKAEAIQNETFVLSRSKLILFKGQ